MAKSMWTRGRRTSHSKIMGINMKLVLPLLLSQLPLFWEGFPLDVGTLLCGLAFIQPQEHMGIVMLKQERAFHKVGSTELSIISLYSVALRFPFTGSMLPSPNHEKQPQTNIPPPPNFTVGTMH